MAWPRPASGSPTYAPGGSAQSSDFERFLPPPVEAKGVTPEAERAAKRLAKPTLFLLFGAPLLLWLSQFVAAQATGDAMISDRREYLLVAGLIAMVLGGVTIATRSLRWSIARSLFLWLASVAVVVLAVGYPVSAIADRREAIVGAAERTFELVVNEAVVHQRADGSLVEGDRLSALAYGQCAEVQRIAGPRGFAWLRRIAAMPAVRSGGLGFPMPRDECFGGAELVATGE